MATFLKGTSLILALAAILAIGVLSAGCKEEDNNGGDNAKVSIVARGGDADTGLGGMGGNLIIQTGIAGADVNILGGGEVSAKFLMPGPVPMDLGPFPWVVNRSVTLKAYLNSTDADANAEVGEYLTLLDDGDRIYRKEGVNDYIGITGLKVLEGVVLTVALNSDDGGQTGEDQASITFTNDVVINGVIRPASLDTGDLNGVVELRDGAPATDRDSGSLYINCANFSLNGRIDAAGKDATVAGQRGGFGGSVHIVATINLRLAGSIDLSGGDGRQGGDGGDAGWDADSLDELTLVSNVGELVNRANISAGGGDGAQGGNASGITLRAIGDLVNFGTAWADGGKGFNGDGGNAGPISLQSLVASVHNRGNLSARGGDAVEDGVGGPVIAGTGGNILLTSTSGSSNTGNLDVSGGDAAVDGVGGPAASVQIMANNPASELINRARILARGGESVGVGIPGGHGGIVVLISGSGSSHIQGRIDASGGAGDLGGSAGTVQVFGGAGVWLLGYDGGLHVDGGDGAMGGGNGMVQINASGNLTSRVPISGDAGDSDLGAGPPGGNLIASAQQHITFLGRASFQGSNAAGGAGSNGGVINMNSVYGIDFSGNVLISGGDAGGAGDFNGGAGGVFTLTNASAGNVNVQGGVSGAGGEGIGMGAGGPGGHVVVAASEHVLSRAYYLVGGGDGDRTVGTGGPGGTIVLDSNVATPSTYSGRYDAAGGEANTLGPDGNITVDGVVVWP